MTEHSGFVLSVTTLLLLCVTACALKAVQDAEHNDTTALIVVDVQNCFMPDGQLPVPDGHAIIPVINGLISSGRFRMIAFTQDWHPPGHISFLSTHNQRRKKETTPAILDTGKLRLQYTANGSICSFEDLFGPDSVADCSGLSNLLTVEQSLWPDHCVANTPAAELDPCLQAAAHGTPTFVVRKGFRRHLDAYSAFWDNGHVFSTGLNAALQMHGITDLCVVGLATEYCVLWTVKDALLLGYKVTVVSDATRGITGQAELQALCEMVEEGAKVVGTRHLDGFQSVLVA